MLAGRGVGLSQIVGLEAPLSAQERRLLVFAVDGNLELPKITPPVWPQPPVSFGSDAQIDRGAALYAKFCIRCHGAQAVSDGSVPDLRRLAPQWYDNFDAVVRGGMMEAAGMPRFDDVLDEAQAEDVKAYVLHLANEDWQIRQMPGWWREFLAWFYDKLAAVLLWFA